MRPNSSLLLLIALSAGSALAGPLVGTSGQLTLPTLTGPTSLAIGTVATTAPASGGNHTGTWAAPANSAWWGTYQGTGPVPTSAVFGSFSFDFTTLNSLYLPANTYLRLGDLDTGEVVVLRAYDASGALLTTPWITDLVAVLSNQSTDFTQAFMPSWAFNTTNGNLTLTGEVATGNPLSVYIVQTSYNISKIELEKPINNSLAFASGEVPEPATLTLLGAGLLAVGLRRRRHSAELGD